MTVTDDAPVLYVSNHNFAIFKCLARFFLAYVLLVNIPFVSQLKKSQKMNKLNEFIAFVDDVE